MESSSPRFGCSEADAHSRSMMPRSMGCTMPRRGLWEGSPSQQASISCQHSSSNTGRRSGRAPGDRRVERRPGSATGPVPPRGLTGSQTDGPRGAQEFWLRPQTPRLEPDSNGDRTLERTGIGSRRIGNFKEKKALTRFGAMLPESKGATSGSSPDSLTVRGPAVRQPERATGGPAAGPGLSLPSMGAGAGSGQGRACGSYLFAHCSRDGLCWRTSQMLRGA